MMWPTVLAALAIFLFVFSAPLEEWHHFYIGALIYLVALLCLSPAFMWLGALVMIDDGLQHATKHQSPLNWLYQHSIARISLIRRLNEWLDRMMAR